MEDIDVMRSFAILNRTYRNRFAEAMRECGVSYSECIVLVNVGYGPGLVQDELCRELAIDKAQVARSVKRLEEGGLARTERSAANRRGGKLYLTEAGEGVFRRMKELNRDWVGLVMAGVPPAERRSFYSCLASMVAAARGASA